MDRQRIADGERVTWRAERGSERSGIVTGRSVRTRYPYYAVVTENGQAYYPKAHVLEGANPCARRVPVNDVS
jgi:hypothetical protein